MYIDHPFFVLAAVERVVPVHARAPTSCRLFFFAKPHATICQAFCRARQGQAAGSVSSTAATTMLPFPDDFAFSLPLAAGVRLTPPACFMCICCAAAPFFVVAVVYHALLFLAHSSSALSFEATDQTDTLIACVLACRLRVSRVWVSRNQILKKKRVSWVTSNRGHICIHTYPPPQYFVLCMYLRLFVLQFNSTLASPVVVRFPTAHSSLSSQLFSKIVRADYPPIDNTLYNEHFGNLVAHLLIPDPNLRPKITVVSGCARCR